MRVKVWSRERVIEDRQQVWMRGLKEKLKIMSSFNEIVMAMANGNADRTTR